MVFKGWASRGQPHGAWLFAFQQVCFVIVHIFTIIFIKQVQRPVPEPDPEVGDRLVQHQRDPGEMAACAEHVGLP